MTNRDLAQLRDPERKQAGWWLQSVKHGDFNFTGPDWHADDLACFRDWRPVLLAAGCRIVQYDDESCRVTFRCEQIIDADTYRAAILAAVAWLAEHKPTLLREAIAQVEGGGNE